MMKIWIGCFFYETPCNQMKENAADGYDQSIAIQRSCIISTDRLSYYETGRVHKFAWYLAGKTDCTVPPAWSLSLILRRCSNHRLSLSASESSDELSDLTQSHTILTVWSTADLSGFSEIISLGMSDDSWAQYCGCDINNSIYCYFSVILSWRLAKQLNSKSQQKL